MAGWHEDFEDAPEVEERYNDSDEECECDECDDCSEHEEDQDHLLAQQELEDYEGLSGWNEDYNDGF
jgi:hypothetical protein